jgi:N-acetylmuramoyl-L-alanine amidase
VNTIWTKGSSGTEAVLALPSITSKLNGRSRRKYIRWGLIAGNFILLLSVAIFVLVNRSASQTVRSSTFNSAIATASTAPTPLDQLSSAQIALQAAQLTGVAELTAIRNQADSEIALTSFVPNDETTLSKPQIVSTSLKSKQDIVHYTVKAGDTVDSLAAKFNLTVGSITGSNNLPSTALKPGTIILLPPANGLIYRVKGGDTIASIISKYGADRELTILVNDAENGVKPGEYIWIPNVAQPSVAAPRSFSASVVSSSFVPTFGYNGYDFGYCTWFVASVIAVPSNWGNANTWDDYARRTPGWAVLTTPRAGAIGQTDGGGLGHVAIVTAVSPDGSQIQYKDMNGIAGWGRVGFSGWVSASHFPHYIVHS